MRPWLRYLVDILKNNLQNKDTLFVTVRSLKSKQNFLKKKKENKWLLSEKRHTTVVVEQCVFFKAPIKGSR